MFAGLQAADAPGNPELHSKRRKAAPKGGFPGKKMRFSAS
jgi:hypothetical protein